MSPERFPKLSVTFRLQPLTSEYHDIQPGQFHPVRAEAFTHQAFDTIARHRLVDMLFRDHQSEPRSAGSVTAAQCGETYVYRP